MACYAYGGGGHILVHLNSMVTPMLTVEYDEKTEEVAICFDFEGMRLLVKELESVEVDGHAHLMSHVWSGRELDDKSLSDHAKLIHHLRLVRRRAPW